MDLREQLQLSTATIDHQDADGKTALSWATTRGDALTVQILLEFGADPNVRSPKGQAPLHWATQAVDSVFETCQSLLRAGARADDADAWGRTPLLYTAPNGDNTASLALFINAGARIDIRDCHKRTPLGYAAKMGRLEHAEYLLSCGADPDIPDSFGVTPLLDSVQQNHHTLIRLLLARGANPHQITTKKFSILHLAAKYGDIETMQCIRCLPEGSPAIDIGSTTIEGHTAWDEFQQRQNRSDELLREFSNLLRAYSLGMSINLEDQLSPPGIMSETVSGSPEELDDEASDVEEFFDAKESLGEL